MMARDERLVPRPLDELAIPNAREIRVDPRPPGCPVDRAEAGAALVTALRERSPPT